jgi:hypothetical protein
MLGQEMAGFFQRSGLDIIKFRESWMRIDHIFYPGKDLDELNPIKALNWVAKAAASEFRRAGFAVLQHLLSGYYDGF